MINADTLEVVTDSENFELVIKISNLVVVSQVSFSYVPFEEDMIVNATATYDPDFSMNSSTPNTSVIAYQYFCNGSFCNLDST